MITHHYGHTVDSEVPITGVVATNNPEFLHEDEANGIDYDFEIFIRDETNDIDDYFNEDLTYLIGYKRQRHDNTKFEIDQNAEYSAISTVEYTQVTQSKWVSRVALCSPWYPGQGVLDTEGEYLAYTLPPAVWGSSDHLPIFKLADIKGETNES